MWQWEKGIVRIQQAEGGENKERKNVFKIITQKIIFKERQIEWEAKF